MKKSNMFFAIVMISFASTFMSCEKEALITDEIQANYEIEIDNEVQQMKNKVDVNSSGFVGDRTSVNYEIEIDNEVQQMKNKVDVNSSGFVGDKSNI